MNRTEKQQHIYTMRYYMAMKIITAILSNIDESQNINEPDTIEYK